MCVYDKHLLASRELQYRATKCWSNTEQPNAGRIPSNQMLVEYRATKSWSEYTTTQLVRAGQNIQPMTQSGKVNSI